MDKLATPRREPHTVLFVCALFSGYCMCYPQFVWKYCDSTGFTSYWWPHPEKLPAMSAGRKSDCFYICCAILLLHLAFPPKQRREQKWQEEWEELERQTAQPQHGYYLDRAVWHGSDSVRKHFNSSLYECLPKSFCMQCVKHFLNKLHVKFCP